jgi:hypothetical protein
VALETPPVFATLSILVPAQPWVKNYGIARCRICSVLSLAAALSGSHDNRILDIADRIVHMEDGKLA